MCVVLWTSVWMTQLQILSMYSWKYEHFKLTEKGAVYQTMCLKVQQSATDSKNESPNKHASWKWNLLICQEISHWGCSEDKSLACFLNITWYQKIYCLLFNSLYSWFAPSNNSQFPSCYSVLFWSSFFLLVLFKDYSLIVKLHLTMCTYISYMPHF